MSRGWPEPEKHVNEFLRDNPGASALEVGAGPFPLIQKFKKRTFVDLHEKLMKHLDGAKIVGDIREIELPKHDLVVLSEVLTHVEPERREEIVKKLANAANKQLIIVDEAFEPIFKATTIDENELKRILETAGFECKLRFTTVGEPMLGKETIDYFLLKATRKTSLPVQGQR